MPFHTSPVRQVALPAQSRLIGIYDQQHLADAFAVPLPAYAVSNPARLASFLMANQAAWVTALMAVRDGIVALFGLKTTGDLQRHRDKAGAAQIHYFQVVESGADEIVMGVDDRHLDFRLSLLCQPTPEAGRELVLSTVVKCHNRFGKLYLAVIAPFHRAVMRSGLRRASRAGWPIDAA